MPEETEAPPAEDETPPGEDGRFPADYVQRLRTEAAQRRVEARTATEASTTASATVEALRGRLLALEVAAAAAGILADPTDLLAHVDADQLNDDDGNPDPAKIKAAATELVSRKAHLAPRPGPSGDVDQGARPPAPEGFDFAAALRRAAN